jgi:gamma-glutamyltranspeptidase/glutathione hydrolase
MRTRTLARLVVIPFFAWAGCASKNSPQTLQEIDPKVRRVEIAPRSQVEARAKKVMISTQGKVATRAALDVLKRGGNLMDAAITASFVISVERPQSTGIGGGGFLIYHEAKTKKNYVFDFRERAPARAHRNLYLDSRGQVIPDASLDGALSVGVPGLVRGLKQVHQKFGKLPWKQTLDPAIRLAETGFEVYPYLKNAVLDQREVLEKFPDSKKIYVDPVLIGVSAKKKMIQTDLAKTLRVIARDPEDFYRGKIASSIVNSVVRHGGILSLEDLKGYRVVEREPLLDSVGKGLQVLSMSPPSSGGVHVIQILKLVDPEAWTRSNDWTAPTLNILAQAMQQAFADRSRYLGDPDFVRVPIRGLLADDYISLARGKFERDESRSGAAVVPGAVSYDGALVPPESSETTHLSLMDAEGNVIVTTQSINGWFGSKLTAEGTGIVLNNTMDDFSAKPGVQNLFGAVGGEENSIAPRKTPLSSMSPTIVFRDGRPVMALGAPGGTRIITSVAQTILNYFVFGRDLYDSIAAPRIHQQWTPDQLSIENQPVPVEVLSQLDHMGWTIKRMPPQSNVMAVVREGDMLIGVADPRDIGTSGGL